MPPRLPSPLRALLQTHSMSSPLSTSLSVPPNAWDSHMHVADPSSFPPSTSATYAPHAALLPTAQAHASSISVPNLVFVQPSTYGTVNSCLLGALRTVGSKKGRGVVVIDPLSPEMRGEGGLERLRAWHELGVRGVRVNLKSVGKVLEREELAEALGRQADVIRPMRTWALQIYAGVEEIRGLGEIMPKLGVKVVVDHLGSPGEEMFEDEGRSRSGAWRDFMEFLEMDGAFTKVSGPYRFSKRDGWGDLEGVVKEVLGARGGSAAVWASDWPHTRFEGTDVSPWVERCLEWCGEDEELKQKLFRDNAKVLWDIGD